jgi:hypothetical protein
VQLREDPRFRALAIPVYRWIARWAWRGPPPRVLANSLPKAGTHLVAQLLRNLPNVHFSGRHHAMPDFRRDPHRQMSIDWDSVRRALSSVSDGQYMTSHFAALPKLLELLADLEYQTVFIVRDPRDVVVSNAFFISNLRRHDLFERFHADFRTTEERIMACIRGFPANDRSRGLESIGERLRSFAGWSDDPRTYTTRFEDLVGARGGGSDHLQLDEVRRIAAHVGRPLDVAVAQAIAQKTWSTRSSTFRKGIIGDWRNHFTEAHVQEFKSVAGAELIRSGYERSPDWGLE